MIRRALQLLPYPLYARMLAVRDFLREMPNPILVYQMGKVGSSSVREMLYAADIPNIHIHFIHAQSRKSAVAFRKKSDTGVPPHIHLGGILNWWLGFVRKRIKVITLVRDPIAASVSGAFELAHVVDFPAHSVERSSKKLAESFEDGWLDEPFGWFESEFQPVTGVDIFAHPFDQEAGWTRITTSRFDILAMTLEKLDSLTPTVLSDFVGRELKPAAARVRSSEVYDEVKRSLKLTDATLQRIYEHPGVKHFYNASQRKAFQERWSA